MAARNSSIFTKNKNIITMKNTAEDLKEQLGLLLGSFREVSRLWYEYGNPNGTESYPFKSSFDEVVSDVEEWVEDFCNQIDDEGAQNIKNIPVLFHTIKNKIGWDKWCDVTGGNSWAINEGYIPVSTDILYCTQSQADKLGI